MYRFCSLMIEDPRKGRVIASSVLIFSDKKKPLVSDLKLVAFSDGHDSREIPEEKTGINGLDIGDYWIVRDVFTRQEMSLSKMSVKSCVFIGRSPIPANFNANGFCIISQ